jgi:hypothetical protein
MRHKKLPGAMDGLGYVDSMNLNSDEQWSNVFDEGEICSDEESDNSFNPLD